MPLFFFLAGFMISREKIIMRGQKIIDILHKRVNRLLVPYLFVGLCYAPFKLILSQFANKPYDISTIWQLVIGVNPDGELWFLYSLFVITVIAGIFSFRISVLGLLLAGVILLWNPWNIITNYLFFFLAGIYMRREKKDFVITMKWCHSIALLLLFIAGNYALLVLKMHAAFLLTALSGTALVLRGSLMIEHRFRDGSSRLATLGIMSMDIYILSDIIKIPFRILLYNKLHFYSLAFIVCLIASVLLSYLVSKYVIRRRRILKYLILGIKE